MDEADFEGTLVLERMAEIGKLDAFFDAIDSDDFEKVRVLLKKASVDPATVALVLRKMSEANGEP